MLILPVFSLENPNLKYGKTLFPSQINVRLLFNNK